MTKGKFPRYQILLVGVVFAIIPATAATFLGIQANKSAGETTCRGHFAWIAGLLKEYKQKHGGLPPLVIYDEAGNPMHSWRMLLAKENLPEEYSGYDMNEPWDSPNNRKFISKRPNFFGCPNESRSSSRQYETGYVGINNGAWRAESSNESIPLTAPKISLLLVEVADSGIPWTKPVDLNVDSMSFTINEFSKPAIRSHDPIGPAVLDTELVTERLNAEKANLTEGAIEDLVKEGVSSDEDRQQLVEQGVFHRYK